MGSLPIALSQSPLCGGAMACTSGQEGALIAGGNGDHCPDYTMECVVTLGHIQINKVWLACLLIYPSHLHVACTSGQEGELIARKKGDHCPDYTMECVITIYAVHLRVLF